MVTVNKRETSFEGLVGKLENGEDGIYNMIANDKNIIFRPKDSITEKNIAEVPGLRELVDSISKVESLAKNARGKKAYLLKKQLIEMRQDQYVLRNDYHQTMRCNSLVKSIAQINLNESITVDENGQPHSSGLLNFFEPEHISAILCNYSKLKEDSWDRLDNDIRWFLLDLERLSDKALSAHPLLSSLLLYKVDGLSNAAIQDALEKEFGVRHSVEYISALWRKKIPKLIAETASKEWLEYHYTFEEKGAWKKCSRCKKIKLANNYFFSKNKTSKDGWYSICKCCRNKKEEK